MDVGTATSLNAFSYQAAVQSTGQAALEAPQAAAAPQTSAISGAQSATGGLDTNSATALLASLGGAPPVGPAPAQAIAAYQTQQAYPASAPAAQTSPSSTPTSTVADTSGQPAPFAQASAATPAGQDPATTAYLQQGVQALINPTVMSLLA
jgi:hypothetical protein